MNYTTIPQYSQTMGAYPQYAHGMGMTYPSYAPAQPMGDFESNAAIGGTTAVVWGVASAASSAACAYHGYKRNNSVGWAIGWAILGGMFPIIAPVIAFAQGFGEPAKP